MTHSHESNSINTRSADYNPPFVVSGEEHSQWALDIDHRGFVATLYRQHIRQDWLYSAVMPPKLAAFVETFITQNYRALNNQYGCPKRATQGARVEDYGIIG